MSHLNHSHQGIKLFSNQKFFQATVTLVWSNLKNTIQFSCKFREVCTLQRSSLQNYMSNNTTQHEITRHNTSITWHNTSTARDKTSATRGNTSKTEHNTSTTHHKTYFDLLISSLHTRHLVSQPKHSVSGTFPEGPLKVLMSGTYRGPSGDQYKNWWFNEKIVF